VVGQIIVFDKHVLWNKSSFYSK